VYIDLYNVKGATHRENWNLVTTYRLNCKKRSYLDSIHWGLYKEQQLDLYGKYLELDKSESIIRYNLTQQVQDEGRLYEIGISWFNHEFSKNACGHAFPIEIESNRLNMNSSNTNQIKSYINLYNHYVS
jgi:hypothetical protein